MIEKLKEKGAKKVDDIDKVIEKKEEYKKFLHHAIILQKIM